MRKGVLLLLLCSVVLGTAFGQYEEQMYKSFAQVVQGEKEGHRGVLAFRESGAGDNIDIHHMEAHWYVDPAIHYLRGHVTFDFEAREILNDITLDLADSMRVDSVLFRGSTLVYTHSKGLLTIEIPGVLRMGDRVSITIYYEGAPVQSGFGAFQQSTHGPDDTPIIWTLSEPYGASEWWPCKNSLTDKIDSVDIYIHTHLKWRAASNGLLVEVIPNPMGREVTYHWKHHYPIAPYLISMAVTDYKVFADTVASTSGHALPIQNFAYPERIADAKDGTSKVPSMIEFYEDTIAVYPFHKEKYGHAQFGWGGGMEHQTMTSVGGYNYGLLAHELAHQWFGDAVTCKSWSDIWLNEGFATYMTALMERHAFGEQVFENWLTTTAKRVTNTPDGSVWVDDTTSVGRIFSGRLSYRKGAYLLHMLRGVIGDQPFFDGVRSYLTENMWGYATTVDLKKHLEVAADTTLTGFFDDWFYGEGYPTYHAKLKLIDVGGVAVLQLSQTQSDPSVFFYEMPVQVRLVAENGSDTVITVQHQYNNQEFVLQFGHGFIDTLELDPFHWILTGQNTGEIIYELATNTPAKTPIELSPNPASHQIRLVTDRSPASIEGIKVWDAAGHLYPSGTVQEWLRGKDVSGWTPGLYHLQIIWKGGEVLTQSFVVQQ